MNKYILPAIMLSVAAVACKGGKQPSRDSHNHDVHGQQDHAYEEELNGGQLFFSSEQAAAIGLEAEKIIPGPFHRIIKTSGQLVSATGDENILAATASGMVSFAGKNLSEGAPVSVGQTIATISAKNIAEGDPAEKAVLNYQTTLKEYERLSALIRDSLVSQREYAQAKLDFETAKIAYDALSGRQTARGITVASTIDGYVKNRLADEGEYVSLGQPLLTVTRSKRLQLRADVSEKYYSSLSAIHTANFKTPYSKAVLDLTDLNGKVVSYGKSTASGSAFIPVIFELNNTGALVPGSYVEVYLKSLPIDKAITVPLTALIEEQGLHFVYLQTGKETYKKQEVTTGEDNGKDVLVLSGLREGDIVVTKGAYYLKLSSISTAIPHSHAH